MFGADGQENIPHRDWVRIFGEVVQDVKQEMKQQGREHAFLGAKVSNLHFLFFVSLIAGRRLYIQRSSLSPRKD